MSNLVQNGTAIHGQDPPLSVQRRLSDLELTMMPEVAIKALKLAEDPDCSIGQLGQVVSCDGKLSLDMLAMANSVAFGSVSATADIQKALIRIGLDRCRQLIIASCYKSMIAKCTLNMTWVRNSLWRHSIYCGIVCRLLDEQLELGLDGRAFTAGLMHDVGRLLLATLEPDTYDMVDGLEFLERSVDPRIAEQAAWGTDHSILGGWFLRQCGLPMDIVAAALLHHDGPGDIAEAPVVAVTCLADDITNHFQNHDSVEGYVGEESPALAWLSGHYGKKCEAKFLACVEDVMRQALVEMVQVIAGESNSR